MAMMRISAALIALLLISAVHGSAQSTIPRCREERAVCDRRCENGATYVFNTTISEPRFCDMGNASISPGRMCEKQSTQIAACTSGCREETVLTRLCNGDECARLAQDGCGEEEVVVHGCDSCIDNFDTHSRYLVLPFGDDHASVRNVRCFAAFFEEIECDGVSEVCRMGSRAFDSVLCSMKVCWQCRRIELFDASDALARYCRYLEHGACRRVRGGSARLAGLVRQHEECVNGCRKRVLGCGKRKIVCTTQGDMCETRTVRRFACGGRQTCGARDVTAVGTVTVQKCTNSYCQKRICD